jgi:hypothetical protein
MNKTELPEMMTKAEYRRAQTRLDQLAGLECAGSIQRLGDLEAEHLRYVRNAVYRHADVHVENWADYRGIIDGLSHYSVNGNIAGFDSNKRPLSAADKAKQAQDARNMGDYLKNRRKIRREWIQ